MFKVNDRWFETREEAQQYATDLENHYAYDPDEPIEVEELTSGRPPDQKNLVWGCKGRFKDGVITTFILCTMWDTEKEVGEYFLLPGVGSPAKALAVLKPGE